MYTVNLHELLLYYRLSPFFSFFHSPSAIEPTKPPEAGTRNTLAQRTLTADTRSFPAYLPDTQWKDSYSTQSTAVATARRRRRRLGWRRRRWRRRRWRRRRRRRGRSRVRAHLVVAQPSRGNCDAIDLDADFICPGLCGERHRIKAPARAAWRRCRREWRRRRGRGRRRRRRGRGRRGRRRGRWRRRRFIHAPP